MSQINNDSHNFFDFFNVGNKNNNKQLDTGLVFLDVKNKENTIIYEKLII